MHEHLPIALSTIIFRKDYWTKLAHDAGILLIFFCSDTTIVLP